MPRAYRRDAKKGNAGAVALSPLTAAELLQFHEMQVAEFAEEKRRAGQWTPGEAVSQSREVIRNLLGDDPAGRGHRLMKGVDERGNRVGWIWVGPPPARLNLRGAWLYQITVDPPMRGRGLGRGMLAALESRLAAEGVPFLYLNVFKWNRVAWSLYASMGYRVVLESGSDARMRKRLAR